MKPITFLALLTSFCPLFAADVPKAGADPVAEAFFPSELVLLAQDRIALTPEQHDALRAAVATTQPRVDELHSRLQSETAALAALAKQEHVDETALGAQLDKLLDVERELKHLHYGLQASIKNLLTGGQQAKLREIMTDHSTHAQLGEDAQKRLAEKAHRVEEGAQKWAASGRDPSVIAQAMEEKVKPLVDAEKILEAEAELDRLLEQLKQDAK